MASFSDFPNGFRTSGYPAEFIENSEMDIKPKLAVYFLFHSTLFKNRFADFLRGTYEIRKIP